MKICILCQNEFQDNEVTQFIAFHVKEVFRGIAEFDVNDIEVVYLCKSCYEIYNKALNCAFIENGEVS